MREKTLLPENHPVWQWGHPPKWRDYDPATSILFERKVHEEALLFYIDSNDTENVGRWGRGRLSIKSGPGMVRISMVRIFPDLREW